MTVTEGSYTCGEGSDNEVMFFWRDSRFEIIDKALSKDWLGDYAKGWVRFGRHDLLDFLLESEFLEQHGFKISRINEVKQ